MRDLDTRGILARLEDGYRRSLLTKHPLKDRVAKPVVQACIRVAEGISSFDTSPIRSLPQRIAMLVGAADRQLVGAISLFVTEGCVFWDVGANIGHITRLLARRTRGAATAYAFEPNPDVFDVLARNLAPATSARAIRLALGAADGKMSLFVGDSCLLASASREWVAGRDWRLSEIQEHVVEVRSGDSLIRTGEAKAPQVMKIDVEGHELAVLEGLRDHIAAARDLAVGCEFNPTAMQQAGHEPLELFQVLWDAHFSVWHIDASGSARSIPAIDAAKRFAERVGGDYVNIFAVKGHEDVVNGWRASESRRRRS
jgi:FkbM family methyltransferase